MAALKLPTDVSVRTRSSSWANWTAYLDYDEDAKNYPRPRAFIKEDRDPRDLFGGTSRMWQLRFKVKPQLQASQDIRQGHPSP